MPVDAGGNVSRPPSPIPVSGQIADAPQVNVPIDDIYAVLNMLMFLDGRKPLRGNIPMNGNRARGAADGEQPQDYVTLSQLQAAISGAATVPTGAMQPYTISSSVAPAGWVFANGQTLNRATFPMLWAAVQGGNNLAASEGSKTRGQYGPGNGTTTFTVPNLQADNGYFIRPVSTGRAIGSVQADALGTHTHTGTALAGGNHTHNIPALPGTGTGGDPGNPYGIWRGQGSPLTGSVTDGGIHTHNLSINATGATETRPQNVAYPVIIKA